MANNTFASVGQKSLIIFLVVLIRLKLYTSRKKIKIDKIIKVKIENFCAPPFFKSAERKAILKSSLLTGMYPVREINTQITL